MGSLDPLTTLLPYNFHSSQATVVDNYFHYYGHIVANYISLLDALMPQEIYVHIEELESESEHQQPTTNSEH